MSSLPHRAPANEYDDDDEVNEEDGLGSSCEEPAIVSRGIDDDDRDSTISEDEEDDALNVKNIGILAGSNEDSTDKLFAADNDNDDDDDDDDDDDVDETPHRTANTPSDTVLSTDDEDEEEVEEQSVEAGGDAGSRQLARNLTGTNVDADAALLRFGEEVFVEEEEELILYGDGTGAQRHCRHHECRQSRHIDGAEQCIHVVHEEHRHCGDSETPSLPSSRGHAGSELLAWRAHHLGRGGPPSDSEIAPDESVVDTATPTPVDMSGASETRLRRRLRDIEGHVQHALGLMNEATSATSYFHPRHGSLEREHPGSRPESTSEASLVNYDAVARRRTATAAACHRRRSSTTTTHVSRIVQPHASSGTVAHYRRQLQQRRQQHEGASVADVSDLHRHSHTAALDVFDCDDDAATASVANRRRNAAASTSNESSATRHNVSSLSSPPPPHTFESDDVLHRDGNRADNNYDDIDDADDDVHIGSSHSPSSRRDRQQTQQEQQHQHQEQQQRWRTSVSPVVDYRHIRYTYSSIVEDGRAAGSGSAAVGASGGARREGAETASPPAEYYPADWSHPRELDEFLREFQQSMELAEYEPSLAHASEQVTGVITPPLPYQLPLDALSTVTTDDHDVDSFERYMAATEALHRYNQNHYEMTTGNEHLRHHRNHRHHEQQLERHSQRRGEYDTSQPHQDENAEEADGIDARADTGAQAAEDQEPTAAVMSPPESFFTPRVQGVHGWTWINKQQQQLNQKYKEQLEQLEQQQQQQQQDQQREKTTGGISSKSEFSSVSEQQQQQQSTPTASSPKRTEKTEDKSPASSLVSPPTRCYFAFRGPVVPRNRVNVNLFPLQQQQQQQQQQCGFQTPDDADDSSRDSLPLLKKRGTTPMGLLSGSLAAATAATAATSSHTQQVSAAASGSGIDELLKRVRTPLSTSKAYGGDDPTGAVRRRSTTTLSPKKHTHHHHRHHPHHRHRGSVVSRSSAAPAASSSSAMNAMMNHSMTLERRSRS